HTDDNQQYKTIINLMETSEIPYFFNQQNQSSLYYYAQIVMNLKNTFNLFYHKQTQVYYLFEQTSEQVVMNPKYWQDDYIIGTANDNFYTKDKVLNRELLNDKNYQILLSIKEEDNPCLVKYHFKK
ncbi:MAG: hypothetical protein LBV39_03865, partial [Bacteroidales bacterium]|nr:hypothetical protein [Bacteroidales bacterium]